MPTKNISILLNLHHPYIRHVEKESAEYFQETVLFFEKITDVYIPVLNMLGRLSGENIKSKIGVVISTPVCALLTDSTIKAQYVKHLDRLIELAKKEVSRTKSNKEINKNAQKYLEKFVEAKRYFTEVYEQNLIKAFADYAKKGLIEILATCGTYCFMPHYADMSEILNAQVETGLYSVRHYFGISAEGFFLPEMGYTPGIEKVLRMYGINYTILPSQSFLLSQTVPEKGIFGPARCYNCLSLFAACPSDLTYSENPVYLNKNKDIAWELEASDVSPFIKAGQPRASSGICYWDNSAPDNDANIKNSKKCEGVYNIDKVYEQLAIDAEDFVLKNAEKIESASKILKDTDVSLNFVFDDEMLGQKWAEGPYFVESIIKGFIKREINVVSFSDLLFDKFSLQKITPYFAAGTSASYGENLLSGKNGWMIRFLRKACMRIVDLADRFPEDTGLKVRLLNLGSRELMLAQSVELARMIEDNYYAEYAEKQFKDCILSFTAVFDALGSNTVSTEWLCNLEKEHPIFPWMNYRIFSKKK